MKLIEGSETSAYNNQTPGKHPKEHIIHSKHGERLKSSKQLVYLVLSPTYALIYFIKILSQSITLVALFTPTCFDLYESSSGSTAGPC